MDSPYTCVNCQQPIDIKKTASVGDVSRWIIIVECHHCGHVNNYPLPDDFKPSSVIVMEIK